VLGFTAAQIEASFPEEPGDFGVRSNFREGMQAHAGELNDPPPSNWEEGYRTGEIDAMILLADDDEAFLLRQAGVLITELEEFSTVLMVERGNALRTDSGEGIEHFSYVDGRSQPYRLYNRSRQGRQAG
jgi:deferrochelatase/peroxidase EfeB